jgi:hypothetical protein
LTANEIKHQTPNSKNKIEGSPPNTFYSITGNSIIIKAENNHRTLTAFENDFGCTIYDKYIQTTGPAVNPKILKKKNIPQIIIISLTVDYYSPLR